ncbi:MAG: 50S ribosomal protein L5 [Methanobacteriota archaeon]|nr:MAG: 50S ribosomal protein L5 [Euryarchaeota archaeon]
MRTISVEKVVVNIGVGEAGEKLLKAVKVLELVTGQKPVQTLSKSTIRDWGIRRSMPIGARVTLRGPRAEEFLRKALSIRSNRLAAYSFDPRGNFSFGVPDYTDFAGMKYDPEIGVFGMDVAVALQRPGYRISRRKIARRRIPKAHRISKDEGIEFVRSSFQVEVVE